MTSLNKVMMIGNLTADPELRNTPSGTAVTDLRLALNRSYTTEAGERREETTFVDATVWGRQAETTCQFLSKGSPVYLEGRLNLEKWQDKTTGDNRQKLKIVAERVQFLPSTRQGDPPHQGDSARARVRESQQSQQSQHQRPRAGASAA